MNDAGSGGAMAECAERVDTARREACERERRRLEEVRARHLRGLELAESRMARLEPGSGAGGSGSGED
jgi:hypothetical protein